MYIANIPTITGSGYTLRDTVYNNLLQIHSVVLVQY